MMTMKATLMQQTTKVSHIIQLQLIKLSKQSTERSDHDYLKTNNIFDAFLHLELIMSEQSERSSY